MDNKHCRHRPVDASRWEGWVLGELSKIYFECLRTPDEGKTNYADYLLTKLMKKREFGHMFSLPKNDPIAHAIAIWKRESFDMKIQGQVIIFLRRFD
jgi:hypothetical protein